MASRRNVLDDHFVLPSSTAICHRMGYEIYRCAWWSTLLTSEHTCKWRRSRFLYSFRPSGIKNTKKLPDGAQNRWFMSEISTVRHVLGHFDAGRFSSRPVKSVGIRFYWRFNSGFLDVVIVRLISDYFFPTDFLPWSSFSFDQNPWDRRSCSGAFCGVLRLPLVRGDAPSGIWKCNLRAKCHISIPKGFAVGHQ